MTTEPTDAEIVALIEKHLGLKPRRDDTVIDRRTGLFHDVQRYRDFVHAVLAKWGQPSGAGEAAERYRNAIASACEGWTMPDGLRKHLETALWSPPTPQPTQTVPPAGREPLTAAQVSDLLESAGYWSRDPGFINGIRYAEAAHGIKAKEAGDAE